VSKIKEITKMFGVGVLGVVYFVVSIAVGLALTYFVIKFVISTGDKIFNKDKTTSEVETRANSTDIRIAKDNKALHDDYIKDCKAEGINESACVCIFNGLWVEFTKDDIRQIVTTQQYTDPQTEIQRQIVANCGSDATYYP